MVTVQEFQTTEDLSPPKNGMRKICVVHSEGGYIFAARYRAIKDGEDYCHHYQITFDHSGTEYHIGQWPKLRSCREADREEFFEYLEANWPEDVEWLLFHPELYSVRFSPDV